MKKIDLTRKYEAYTLPQDSSIEIEVLSACLNHKTSLVLEYLSIDDIFYTKDNYRLFKAIKQAHVKNGEVTVLNILRTSKDSVIASLASKVKEVLYNEKELISNCLRLVELFIARETIIKCSEAVEQIYSNDALAIEESLRLVDTQKTLLDSILNTKKESFAELTKRVIGDIEGRMNKLENSVIMTGIYDIDNDIGGFENGTVNVIAARPGMGKTALTIQLIYNVGFIGQMPVLAFNLEMTKEELVKRLLALHTQNGNFEMRSGFFGNQAKFDSFKEKAETFVTDKIFLIDNVYDNSEINRLIRSYKDTEGVALCIIDYIQLVSAGGGFREQEVSKISRELKMTAKTNGIPIIALAQLSRAVESRGGDKRPILSDLRESGSIEQDADSVLMLYRAEKYGILQDSSGLSTVGIMEILVMKYRNGMADISVPVKYEPKFNMITSINKKPVEVPTRPINLGVQASIDSFEKEIKFGDSDEEVKF